MPHNITSCGKRSRCGVQKLTNVAPGKEAIFRLQSVKSRIICLSLRCSTSSIAYFKRNVWFNFSRTRRRFSKSWSRILHHARWVLHQRKTDDKGLQEFDQDKALDERPSYVVFNGKKNALMGEKMLQAKVGETVRIFVGNAGPNLVSSFRCCL